MGGARADERERGQRGRQRRAARRQPAEAGGGRLRMREECGCGRAWKRTQVGDRMTRARCDSGRSPAISPVVFARPEPELVFVNLLCQLNNTMPLGSWRMRAEGLADPVDRQIQPGDLEAPADPPRRQRIVQHHDAAGPVAVDLGHRLGQRHVAEHQHALAPAHGLLQVGARRRRHRYGAVARLLAGFQRQFARGMADIHAAPQAGDRDLVAAAAATLAASSRISPAPAATVRPWPCSAQVIAACPSSSSRRRGPSATFMRVRASSSTTACPPSQSTVRCSPTAVL